MSHKTREQKIRLQLRRLQDQLREKQEPPVKLITISSPVAKTEKSQLNFQLPVVLTKTSSQNYSYVKGDLTRIVILTFLVFALEAVLYLTQEFSFGILLLRVLEHLN